MSELATRAIAGVVMIAVALGALWAGGIAFWLLVSAAALAMMGEWAGLMKAPRWKLTAALLLMGLLLAAGRILATDIGFIDIRTGMVAAAIYIPMVELAGIGAILLALGTLSARMGAGLLYAGLPALGLIVLRGQPDGVALTLWTLTIVWATDIGAYFAGRAIGGPKLAPRLSPNKTWAGLIGGMIAAALTGLLVARFAALPLLFWWAGGVMAVMAQGGDLFESWLKRRAGVKDSGRLLPGHGGALDRLDGVVPVATLTALLVATGWAR